MNVIFLDRFDTVSELRGKKRTYKNIKTAVLAAGRFSCFDVNTEKDGRIFTKLCHDDPEIETFDLGYPWVGVRRKTSIAKPCPDCDGRGGFNNAGGATTCETCEGTGKRSNE